jgi:electron transport complex protein RnfB
MGRSRRNFLRICGHAAGATALAAAALRIFSPPAQEAEFIAQARRFAWQIDPEKCRYCGVCETACVRRPSAVKALNDQKKCSNCVVCYGHIKNLKIDSDKIDSEGKRVCPHDAVLRKHFCGGIDGMFLYSQDHALCTGCAACVKKCIEHGTKSMFLAIRPDLCLGCNECAIAVACPHQAIERIPREPVDDFRGVYGLEELYWMEEQG